MTSALMRGRSDQAVRPAPGTDRLHSGHPGRARRRAWSGRTAPASPRCCNWPVGLLDPTARARSRCSAPGRSAPAQLAQVGFVAQDTPVYAGLTVADHLRIGAHLNPRWDAALAERRIAQARPGPDTEGRQALRRPARPARPDPRRGEAARAAAPRRAGGGLDPLARRDFLQGLMEFDRRAGHQRRAVLAPGRRPGTGLRLPDRAGRLPGAGRRRRRRPARHPPPAGRAAARPRRPAAPGAAVIEQSHTERAVHTGRPQHRADRRPGLDRSTGWTWRTSCWRT